METDPDLSRVIAVAAAWYGVLAVASCALYGPPGDALNEAQSAIIEAQAAGAEMTAPVELAQARDKLELGRHYLAEREYKPARWLFQQAEIDARLAAMKTGRRQAIGAR